MANINELNTCTDPNLGDLVAIFDTSNGDTRKISLTALQTLLVSTSGTEKTQYEAPANTGFTITLPNESNSVYLDITPTGTMATGTIYLPVSSYCVDGQTVKATTSNTITALTINGNGANLQGAPTTLTAGGYFTMRFNAITSTWKRIG